jgi:hypothetical protein
MGFTHRCTISPLQGSMAIHCNDELHPSLYYIALAGLYGLFVVMDFPGS